MHGMLIARKRYFSRRFLTLTRHMYEIFVYRANFKSIGSPLLMTRFLVRQNRFGAPTPTFSQKATKNQILGCFPPLPSTRDVLDIPLFIVA